MTASIYSSTSVYPEKYHAKIKISKIILNKSDYITYSDIDHMISIIEYHLHEENLSPKQIQLLYNIKYSDFGMFIKKCLGIKLKTCKEALDNYLIKSNKKITDEKILYWNNCNFQFDIYTEPNIPGYHLLDKYQFHKAEQTTLTTSIHRDHMVSKLYGWQNNIPAEHIRHPANCELLLSIDNITKSSDSSITYDELLKRINSWEDNSNIKELKRTILKSPKSKEHRKNISKGVISYYKSRNTNSLSESLTEMEDLLASKGIELASKELGLTRKQFWDNLRYRRRKLS